MGWAAKWNLECFVVLSCQPQLSHFLRVVLGVGHQVEFRMLGIAVMTTSAESLFVGRAVMLLCALTCAYTALC